MSGFLRARCPSCLLSWGRDLLPPALSASPDRGRDLISLSTVSMSSPCPKSVWLTERRGVRAQSCIKICPVLVRSSPCSNSAWLTECCGVCAQSCIKIWDLESKSIVDELRPNFPEMSKKATVRTPRP